MKINKEPFRLNESTDGFIPYTYFGNTNETFIRRIIEDRMFDDLHEDEALASVAERTGHLKEFEEMESFDMKVFDQWMNELSEKTGIPLELPRWHGAKEAFISVEKDPFGRRVIIHRGTKFIEDEVEDFIYPFVIDCYNDSCWAEESGRYWDDLTDKERDIEFEEFMRESVDDYMAMLTHDDE